MEADEEVEKCSNCEHILTDEEYITIFEDRGKYRGEEEIVVGYKCNCCGQEEDY